MKLDIAFKNHYTWFLSKCTHSDRCLKEVYLLDYANYILNF